MATESKMIPVEPVTLTVKLTVTKATANGLLGGITSVDVLTVNGKVDGRFYGFADVTGRMVLNFKPEGRPAKRVKADKPAPKALTDVDMAAIPAPATKPAKGKGHGKPAAEAEAPSEMELMLERMLEKKLKEMLGK